MVKGKDGLPRKSRRELFVCPRLDDATWKPNRSPRCPRGIKLKRFVNQVGSFFLAMIRRRAWLYIS